MLSQRRDAKKVINGRFDGNLPALPAENRRDLRKDGLVHTYGAYGTPSAFHMTETMALALR